MDLDTDPAISIGFGARVTAVLTKELPTSTNSGVVPRRKLADDS